MHWSKLEKIKCAASKTSGSMSYFFSIFFQMVEYSEGNLWEIKTRSVRLPGICLTCTTVVIAMVWKFWMSAIRSRCLTIFLVHIISNDGFTFVLYSKIISSLYLEILSSKSCDKFILLKSARTRTYRFCFVIINWTTMFIWSLKLWGEIAQVIEIAFIIICVLKSIIVTTKPNSHFAY